MWGTLKACVLLSRLPSHVNLVHYKKQTGGSLQTTVKLKPRNHRNLTIRMLGPVTVASVDGHTYASGIFYSYSRYVGAILLKKQEGSSTRLKIYCVSLEQPRLIISDGAKIFKIGDTNKTRKENGWEKIFQPTTHKKRLVK